MKIKICLFLFILSFFHEAKTQNCLDSIIAYDYDKVSNQSSFVRGSYYHYDEFGLLKELNRINYDTSIIHDAKYLYDSNNNLLKIITDTRFPLFPISDRIDTVSFVYEYDSNKKVKFVTTFYSHLKERKDVQPLKVAIEKFGLKNNFASSQGAFTLGSESIIIREDELKRITEFEFYSCDDTWEATSYIKYLDEQRVKEQETIYTYIDSGKIRRHNFIKYYYSEKKFKKIQKIKERDNLINVFPNPFQSTINIKSMDGKILLIDVFNFSGKKIQSFDFSNSKDDLQEIKTILIPNLANGVYILRVKTEKNIFTKKVIKMDDLKNRV